MVEKLVVDILEQNFEEKNEEAIKTILDLVRPTFSKYDEYNRRLHEMKSL